MKKLKRLEKKEFEEILSERGCAFIKDGVVYNYMDLYHVEDSFEIYYMLCTKEGKVNYSEPPIRIMMEMYLKYKKEGCSIKF